MKMLVMISILMFSGLNAQAAEVSEAFQKKIAAASERAALASYHLEEGMQLECYDIVEAKGTFTCVYTSIRLARCEDGSRLPTIIQIKGRVKSANVIYTRTRVSEACAE